MALQTIGPFYPGTVVNDDSVGGSGTPWGNVNNAKLEDGNLASAFSAFGQSSRLVASNFNIDMPEFTPLGITVVWKVIGDSNGITQDYVVSLLVDGVVTSENKAVGGAWDMSLTDRTYGGDDDLWGETLTFEQVNSTDFGASMSTICLGFGGNIGIDVCKIFVTYDDAGGGGGGGIVKSMFRSSFFSSPIIRGL